MSDQNPVLPRRDFLTAAATSAAAPMVWLPGRRAAGQEVVTHELARPKPVSNTGANERITVGFIGMGIRARNLMNGGWLKNPDIQVVAVCDVDTTRREHRQQMVNEAYDNADCAAYTDYRELLARDDIDAVAICTPDHWHAAQIIHACEAGKDVYCEKPLTLTLREAQVVIQAAHKHGRVFQTGSQQRTEYGHRFVDAIEYVRTGRIGDIRSINVGVGNAPVWCDLPEEDMEPGLDWDKWLGPAPMRGYNAELSPRGVHSHYPRWRGYREYAGGYLADMGAHHFDIVQWGMGMDDSGPVKVVPPDNTESGSGAMLVYANGTRLIHGGPGGTTFTGADGIIHVDRGRTVTVPADLMDKPLEDGDERLPRKTNHLTDWIDCMRSREKPVCDVEVGARSVAICHLMNIAYFHGRALQWDPQAWQFVGDDEANAWLDYERREGYELPAV